MPHLVYNLELPISQLPKDQEIVEFVSLNRDVGRKIAHGKAFYAVSVCPLNINFEVVRNSMPFEEMREGSALDLDAVTGFSSAAHTLVE